MALLKKIRGSTLMETLVATVLIVLIFMIASMLMNAIFSASIKGNNQQLTEHLNQLEYAQKNGLITVPYTEEWGNWLIEIYPETVANVTYLTLESTHKDSKKQLKTYASFE